MPQPAKIFNSARQQLKRRVSIMQHPKLLAKLFNLYPPYLGARVQVDAVDFAQHRVCVSMPLLPLNKNIVGTQFGGSLYSMTDPFMMFLLMDALGNDYVVWDKAACIDFIKAGTSRVFAEFHLTDDEIAKVRALASDGRAVFREYTITITDEAGDTVATVKKTVYVRLRAFSKSKNQTVAW